MENLIFSLNTVLPVFILGLTGYLMVSNNILTREWASRAAGACFKLFLPIMLFKEVYTSNILEDFDVKYVIFGVLGIVFTMAAACVVAPIFVKDRKRCGAVAHSCFRSNFVLLGIPILTNMYGSGSAGMVPATSLLPFAVATFNICAVVCFSVFAPKEEGKKGGAVGRVLLGIVKNPFIIAIVLGAGCLALKIQFPAFVTKSIANFSAMASPLVLLAVGAQFDFGEAKGTLKTTLAVCGVRLARVPLIMGGAGYLMGWRGPQLAALYVLFGSPTATSGAALATNMGSDGQLTGEITLISTLLSPVSFFIGVVLMKTLGLV